MLFKKLFSKKKETSPAPIIEKYLKDDDNESRSKYRVLLLGAGGTGTTTLLKKLEIACKEIELDECSQYFSTKQEIDLIHRCILMDIYDLCKHNIKLNAEGRSGYKLSSKELTDICQRVSLWSFHDILSNPGIILHASYTDIAKLWKDDAIKETWKDRSNCTHMDNTPYYLSNPTKFIGKDYKPSPEDYLMIRDQTSGIVTQQLKIDDKEVEVTDVGGIRAERRKWMRLFDNIDLVIYMTQLTGYCYNLYEDHKKNRLDEEFELFSKVINEECFEKSKFMLIFSKYDLFMEKLKEVPFTVYNKDFANADEDDPQKVLPYIKEEYMKRFKKSREDEELVCLTMNLIDTPLDIDDELLVYGFCKYRLNVLRWKEMPNDVIRIVYRYYTRILLIRTILDILDCCE